MADNEETPPAAAPKPPARRAPRKSTQAKSASDKPASKPRRKSAPTASNNAEKTASATKPAAPPKPRSTKRATPPPKRPAKPKTDAQAEADKQPVWKSKAALAGGLAAVGAAATAALLSLRGSTPKKGTAEKGEPAPVGDTTKDRASSSAAPGGTARAHMPDGQDASKSFEAGIADENVIPE